MRYACCEVVWCGPFRASRLDADREEQVRIGVPADGMGSRLDRIKVWLDENSGANGWALKKAALEQSASDAARPLAWVTETYEPSPSQ